MLQEIVLIRYTFFPSDLKNSLLSKRVEAGITFSVYSALYREND